MPRAREAGRTTKLCKPKKGRKQRYKQRDRQTKKKTRTSSAAVAKLPNTPLLKTPKTTAPHLKQKSREREKERKGSETTPNGKVLQTMNEGEKQKERVRLKWED